MEYSVNFENAINKIDEVFDSKELSLLSLLSLSSLQDDNSEETQKEIVSLYDKVEIDALTASFEGGYTRCDESQ